MAALYRAGGWPAEVEGDAFTAPFSAPSTGPSPWQLYRFTCHTAVGVATAEPYGATRWRFDCRATFEGIVNLRPSVASVLSDYHTAGSS